jgi:protease-4
MNPSASAGIMMNGVSENVVFLKDMLDKLGVKVNIVRAGDYKSAGETFTRNSMSDEAKNNSLELISDYYEQLIMDLANSYKVSEDEVIKIIEDREKLLINQEQSIELNLVHELIHFDSLLKKLKIDNNNLIKHSKYIPKSEKMQKDKIAVVYMVGNIGHNSSISSSSYTQIFNDILKDDNIKSVVLRINSGGGSALESEIIHNKIIQLKEKKTVIVSLSDIAASGGYYIASNANKIVADPYTITGSIGVFGMIPDLSGTAEKIGINNEVIGFGKYNRVGNPFIPFSTEFETALQLEINDVYNEFKNRVSEGRNIPFDDVEEIAQGQIWSAKKALDIKLIDEIGGLQDAIKYASSISNVSNYSTVYYPEVKSSFNSLFNFDFDASLKQLVKESSFKYLIPSTVEFFDIFDDIQKAPIQMRAEFLLDFQ